MSVKRYVGDKFVGTDSEKSSVLADATNGASYFATDTLKIYLKEAGSWQEISGGSGGAGNIAENAAAVSGYLSYYTGTQGIDAVYYDGGTGLFYDDENKYFGGACNGLMEW